MTEANERTAPALTCEGGKVPVGEALADAFRRRECRLRAGDVARGDLLERLREHHVSPLDTVLSIFLEQSPGTRCPPTCSRELARANQCKGNPECGPRRLSGVARFQRRVV